MNRPVEPPAECGVQGPFSGADLTEARQSQSIGARGLLSINVGGGNGVTLYGTTINQAGRVVGSPYADLELRLLGVTRGVKALLAVQRGPDAARLDGRPLLVWGGATFEAFELQARNLSSSAVVPETTWLLRCSRGAMPAARGEPSDAFVQCDAARSNATRARAAQVTTAAAPARIVGANAARKRVAVSWSTPTGAPASTVLLGSSAADCFVALADGQTWESCYTGEVWAVDGTSAAVQLTTWEEDL